MEKNTPVTLALSNVETMEVDVAIEIIKKHRCGEGIAACFHNGKAGRAHRKWLLELLKPSPFYVLSTR